MEKELTEVQDELRGMQSKRQEIEKAAAEILENLQSATVSVSFSFKNDELRVQTKSQTLCYSFKYNISF